MTIIPVFRYNKIYKRALKYIYIKQIYNIYSLKVRTRPTVGKRD